MTPPRPPQVKPPVWWTEHDNTLGDAPTQRAQRAARSRAMADELLARERAYQFARHYLKPTDDDTQPIVIAPRWRRWLRAMWGRVR